jgi:molecular chaperone HscC
LIVGIDLGTSNSLITVFRNGEVQLIPNALGSVLTPSAVSVEDDGTIVVGEAARDRAITHPERTALAFKRAMGTKRTYTLGTKSFRPEELSALVLGALKADAQAFLGETVTEAIVTVPAYFNDTQRKATQIAGQLAGLNVRRLLNEPTAAALAYGLLEHQDPEAKLLIVDLGGGTFDVSIIEKFEGIVEVRATAGDNFLGGEDFVDAILERFIRAGGEPLASAVTKSQALRAQLRAKAERLKREASNHPQTTMTATVADQTVELSLNQDDLTQLYAPLLARLRGPIQRALNDTRLTPEEISGVVLAGGATRMPDVRRLAARLFGRMPIAHINPDEVVAQGAAIYAALLVRDEAFQEVVLTDVAPYSLGIEVGEVINGVTVLGSFLPIIERNTVIPASRVHACRTLTIGQTKIDLEVFQGESRLARDNVRLGSLSVQVPKNTQQHEAVDVRFTYNRDGILEVEATVAGTGRTWREVFENNAETLSKAEVERRLAGLQALKVHPRENAVNVAALARADRIFQEHLAARAAVQHSSNVFRAAIERQDPREISRAREALSSFLDKVETAGWSFDDA